MSLPQYVFADTTAADLYIAVCWFGAGLFFGFLNCALGEFVRLLRRAGRPGADS